MEPIRKARLQDLPQILEIEQLSFSGDRFSKRQFRYLISRAKASVLVLVNEQDQAMAYSILLLPKDPIRARIYSIAVHPQSAGSGYGKKLLTAHIQVAKERDYRKIHLEVRKDNLRAQSLYRSLGFVEKGIKQQYYEDGTDAVSFTLTLR